MTEVVAKPWVPVDAAIFTTCATPGATIAFTSTIPLAFDTAELCDVSSTGAEAHGSPSGHVPSVRLEAI